MLLGNKNLFPLRSIPDVVDFVRKEVQSPEPNLVALSIIIGFVENSLTTSRLTSSESIDTLKSFPLVEYSMVDEYSKKYQNLLLTRSDVQQKSIKATRQNLQNMEEPDETTRETIKKISDVIWYSLLKNKDMMHQQSLYSFLHDSKLDCFGVAFATVAGCQLLGYKDVNLSLSEDHAWLNFGKTGDETIEITWHGKGAEDKRGQSVVPGIESQSWIYVNGYAVICDRVTEVVAMCASINPSLSSSSVCLELSDLQQQLLWMLYDLEALKRYPMAMVCLAELEEVSPTENRPTAEALYKEASTAGKKYYKNHHVYPNVALAGYYNRKNDYKKAFGAWAEAGDVIRLYNYCRDDEEIYKEFLDIGITVIPAIMKTESGLSGHSILRDPFGFANLLRFYDGICMWEEGSLTPILHIGWAKPMVHCISKFDFDIRSQVCIQAATEEDYNGLFGVKKPYQETSTGEGNKSPDSQNNNNNNNNNCVKTDDDEKNTSKNISRLEALASACGTKILNPDFLLQGGDKPFTTEALAVEVETNGDDFKTDLGGDVKETVLPESNGEHAIIKEVEKVVEQNVETLAAPEPLEPKRPEITLYSHKMKALKDLLLAEKLNTNAISLQITAQVHQVQGQVSGKKSRLSHGGSAACSESEGTTRSSKRARRD